MKPLWRTLLAGLVLTGVIAAMLTSRAMLLASGREIVVAARPVDPRDIFTGEYVQLAYAFSAIDAPGPDSPSHQRTYNRYRNRTVYVVLRPEGGRYVYDSAAVTYPEVAEDRVVLKGEIASQGGGRAFVTYGIERYYVPEGEAAALEHHVVREGVDIVLAIGPDGTAAVKALRVDGEELYREGLF